MDEEKDGDKLPSAEEDEEKSEQYIEFQIVFPNARSDKKSLLLEEKAFLVPANNDYKGKLTLWSFQGSEAAMR